MHNNDKAILINIKPQTTQHNFIIWNFCKPILGHWFPTLAAIARKANIPYHKCIQIAFGNLWIPNQIHFSRNFEFTLGAIPYLRSSRSTPPVAMLDAYPVWYPPTDSSSLGYLTIGHIGSDLQSMVIHSDHDHGVP